MKEWTFENVSVAPQQCLYGPHFENNLWNSDYPITDYLNTFGPGARIYYKLCKRNLFKGYNTGVTASAVRNL
ncbi:hypothetical protein T01_12503 [Trichinella spiralis]|uniref:Uncharacterized protein n=1 Tax=Trichinella spiralis TaxID=6334 RepID=A0A0V1B6B9_TRISP|nr:hypothetical protein T01_12503 [Trichinella spiralis]